MEEKTIEFKDIKELSDSDIWNYPPKDKVIEKIMTHFDKNKQKYITKISYGKKT